MPLIKHEYIHASDQIKHLGKILGQELVEEVLTNSTIAESGMNEEEYQKRFEEMMNKATAEGQSIKETAEQEARRIIDEARAQAQKILDEERGKGFEMGRNEAFKQLAEHIHEAQQVVEQAKQQRNGIIKSAVPEILKLSMKVAAQVVKAELTSNQDVVMTILRDAIEKISDNEQVVIKVSQHDLQHVRNNRDLIIDLVEAKNLSIVADKHVNDGGCVIETKLGYIDAKVSTKLEMIENALLSIYEEDKVKRETLIKEAIERGEVTDPSRDEDLEELVAAANNAELPAESAPEPEKTEQPPVVPPESL